MFSSRIGSWLPLVAMVSLSIVAPIVACGDDSPASSPKPVQCADGKQDCDGVCVDLRIDPDHCGVCDTSCNSSDVCSIGICKDKCDAHLTNCSRSCVDTKSDIANCGGCGVVCEEGEDCYEGACTILCVNVCDGVCTDVRNDNLNCGICSNPCDDGQICENGECRPIEFQSCKDECDGVCTDILVDNSNCGGCGNECGPGEICRAGVCANVDWCKDLCEGICTDMSSDNNNCGECGIECAHGQGCKNGACVPVVCPTGFATCSGAAGVDCATNLMENDENCGQCGVVCDPYPSWMEMLYDQPRCIQGRCASMYLPTWADGCVSAGGNLVLFEACQSWLDDMWPVSECCIDRGYECEEAERVLSVGCHCDDTDGVEQCFSVNDGVPICGPKTEWSTHFEAGASCPYYY